MIIATYRINQILEFKGAAHLLHWLAENTQQHGQWHSVETYYLGRPDRYGAYCLKQEAGLELSKEDYAHAYRVLKRYKAFCKHMHEVDPEWVNGEKIPYMDNSVEVVQHSRKYPGKTRRVTLVVPHGDAC
jgi:hypothetical protein